jgi:hypothetical protein
LGYRDTRYPLQIFPVGQPLVSKLRQSKSNHLVAEGNGRIRGINSHFMEPELVSEVPRPLEYTYKIHSKFK